MLIIAYNQFKIIMSEFPELENLEKQKLKRIVMPKDAKCYVCGCGRDYIKLRRYNEYCLCEKHFNQLNKYHKIIDSTPRQRKKSEDELKCCICGDLKMASFGGKPYCRRHYLQMTRHGETFNTIYEENEWIDCGNYYECILKDKNSNEVARTKIDKEDYDKLKDFKLYARHQTDKWYALISEKGTSKKYFVHRFLMGLKDSEYSINEVVDHINGNSLDNRKSNLRICTQHENSKNGRKTNRIVGISFIKNYNGTNKSKWTARICHNYKTIYLGYYDTAEEALLARLKKEQELCGEYGPNKDLYYVLNHPSPIKELHKYINSLEGA